MANARAIVKRLKAVKNIRKITRTMELIATARFKKAMDRATEASAYTEKISEIVADLSQSNLSFTHPLLQQRETTKNSRLVILTSNRGLCGGYNGSILRTALKRYNEMIANGENVTVEVAGKRGINFLKYKKIDTLQEYTQFDDAPRFDEVEELGERYVQSFVAGEIDRVEVVYTKFHSVSRQVATLETVLPIGELSKKSDSSEGESAHEVEYEFLPSAKSILQEIVPAAFKAQLFKCFLDAAVSEQISRMVAMKGATENASEMISDLSQNYNRARQSQITSELSEIIGGAAALE